MFVYNICIEVNVYSDVSVKFGGVSKCLSVWRCLEVSRGIWKYLKVFGDI